MERRSAERTAHLLGPEPTLCLRYNDPITRAAGWVVIDTLSMGVAFGGVRAHRGLKWTDLAWLSRLGTLRYQLAQAPLAGARLGLDYDPEAPDFEDVLGRFLCAAGPLLGSVLGIGPDAHISAELLEKVLAKNDLPWRMHAVQQHQGWPTENWQHYQRLMSHQIEGTAVRDLQVARSVAESIAAAGEGMFRRAQTVAVLGRGPLGIEIVRQLIGLGQKVIAFGGGNAGVHVDEGITLETLPALSTMTDPSALYITGDEFYSLQVDTLVLASRNDAVNIDNVGRLRCLLVVEAAARSVEVSAEKVLWARGIPVLPSFASTLGSVVLADRALTAGAVPADAALASMSQLVRTTARELLRLSPTLRITLREAAVRLAFHRWGHTTVPVPLPAPRPDHHDEPPEVL
jgi:glutamate dehydrogenase (NAD(P)+)